MKVGDQLPNVNATLESGETIEFGKLGKPLVLFFYPKAMSPVCTAEACHFRDLATEFGKTGAVVYGVAPDDSATISKFEKDHKLPFPSFSDPDKTLAKSFSATGAFGIMKRLTLVADAAGKVILMYSNVFNANAHATKALEALGSLGNGKS